MAASKTIIRFVSSLPNVECIMKEQLQIIKFLEGAPRATVSGEKYFTAPGKHSFEVNMRDKRVKTAVGFLNEGKTTEYMRDDPLSETHISYGGAGWIHPKELAAKAKYGQGDRVRAEVDFDDQKIKFYVNDDFVGEDEWKETQAYPAISFNGGPSELDVTF